MPSPDLIRSFIAIKIPDDIRAHVQKLQEKILSSGIQASFPHPETLHLTVKFLGDIRPEHIDCIEGCMRMAVAGMVPHRIYAAGLGVFPSVKQARIIWSGIREDTPFLVLLASKLDSALSEQLDLKKDGKIYRPHLTLARIKKNIPSDRIISMIKAFQNVQSPDFPVSGISLFESRLSSSGAVHKQISFIPFAGS